MLNPESLPSADDPEAALAAVVALRHMAAQLESRAVNAALDQGWSWSQIAQVLGVSKQAAHKKHTALTRKLNGESKTGKQTPPS